MLAGGLREADSVSEDLIVGICTRRVISRARATSLMLTTGSTPSSGRRSTWARTIPSSAARAG